MCWNNRGLIFEDLCDQIDNWIDKFSDDNGNCDCIIGGDFNIDFGDTCSESRLLANVMAKYKLQPCDAIFHQDSIPRPTYNNDSLGCSSTIEHFLINNACCVTMYEVLDLQYNFSDHSPIFMSFMYNVLDVVDNDSNDLVSHRDVQPKFKYLRWDYADILSYCYYTGEQLNRIYQYIKDYDANHVTDSMIESIYDDIVHTLLYNGECFVPQRSKSCYKFWWSEELDVLKNNAILSFKAWKASGMPCSGSIYDKYRSDKQVYRKAIRDHKQDEVCEYIAMTSKKP